MRKTWRKLFLLCLACMICMQGLCFAGNGNWEEYYRSGFDVFLADADLVEAREWNGRKYLAVTILHKIDSEKKPSQKEQLLVIDVENRKGITLKLGQQDISGIAKSNNWGEPGEKLLSWVEQNRPDVINEIRTFNQSAPGGNVPNGRI